MTLLEQFPKIEAYIFVLGDAKPTPVQITPEMVERIVKYINEFGKAEGKTTISSVVRHATDVYLKKFNL